MGLLDSIARSVAREATRTAVRSAIDNAMNGNNNGQAAAQLAPAKADIQRMVEYFSYDDNNKEYHAEATFMLSGDFVETRTNAGEIDAVYMYDPSCTEEFTPSPVGDTRPYFMITGDIDEVFVPVRDFEQGKGIQNAIYFQPLQGGKALFKAQINYYKDIMTFYGFRQKFGNNHPWGLCMVYNAGLRGTELEKRLISALDNAMFTLEERLLGE